MLVEVEGEGGPVEVLLNNTKWDGTRDGNPAFSRFLSGLPRPPEADEVGWKDTLKMFPGQVTRIVARWAPQATAVGGVQPGQNQYAFDPTQGPGYAWHCHILDHEDNEMMRPYLPVRERCCLGRPQGLRSHRRIGGPVPCGDPAN